MYLYYEFLGQTIIIWPTVLWAVVYLYVYSVWRSEVSNRPLFHLDMRASPTYSIISKKTKYLKRHFLCIVPLKKRSKNKLSTFEYYIIWSSLLIIDFGKKVGKRSLGKLEKRAKIQTASNYDPFFHFCIFWQDKPSCPNIKAFHGLL